MELVLIWLLFGVVAFVIASSKGRGGRGWFLLGPLFGPFALVVALLPSIDDVEGGGDPSGDGDEPERREDEVCPECGWSFGWSDAVVRVEGRKVHQECWERRGQDS